MTDSACVCWHCCYACVQERIKELTDKFHAELDADRQKFDLLLQEKNEQELEYEEKLKQVNNGLQQRRQAPAGGWHLVMVCVCSKTAVTDK